MKDVKIPTLEEMKNNASKISPYIIKTPVLKWEGAIKEKLVGQGIEVFF